MGLDADRSTRLDTGPHPYRSTDHEERRFAKAILHRGRSSCCHLWRTSRTEMGNVSTERKGRPRLAVGTCGHQPWSLTSLSSTPVRCRALLLGRCRSNSGGLARGTYQYWKVTSTRYQSTREDPGNHRQQPEEDTMPRTIQVMRDSESHRACFDPAVDVERARFSSRSGQGLAFASKAAAPAHLYPASSASGSWR